MWTEEERREKRGEEREREGEREREREKTKHHYHHDDRETSIGAEYALRTDIHDTALFELLSIPSASAYHVQCVNANQRAHDAQGACNSTARVVVVHCG